MKPLIVTAALVRHADRILITRRPEGKAHGGKWEFPGGKLEDDESPQDCLKRELHEELALQVEVGDIFTVVYHRYPRGPILLLVYNCRPLSLEMADIEVSAHAWVTPGELSGYEFPEADDAIVARLQHE